MTRFVLISFKSSWWVFFCSLSRSYFSFNHKKSEVCVCFFTFIWNRVHFGRPRKMVLLRKRSERNGMNIDFCDNNNGYLLLLQSTLMAELWDDRTKRLENEIAFFGLNEPNEQWAKMGRTPKKWSNTCKWTWTLKPFKSGKRAKHWMLLKSNWMHTDAHTHRTTVTAKLHHI